MPRDVSAVEGHRRQRAGALLVDIREDDERRQGTAESAVGCSQGRLLADPQRWLPDQRAEILLICAGGQRSARAADALVAAGYASVASVAGGMRAWRDAGLPMALGSDLGCEDERYARHLVLPQVGEAGQARLARSSVLLVGAGGLGSPCAYYLAAAGVGHLRIVDADRVSRSNLQRQILHADGDVGRLKVESATERLQALNPQIRIEPIADAVCADNVLSLMAGMDVIIDGSDNFPTRYLLNDACLVARKPLVSAAVERFSGQITVFDAGRRRGEQPCYRCVFPEPPGADEAPDCSAAGVLGVLPGLMGVLQATEALKLLLEIGDPLVGRWLQLDALAMRFREIAVPVDSACPVCGLGQPVPRLGDDDRVCAAGRT